MEALSKLTLVPPTTKQDGLSCIYTQIPEIIGTRRTAADDL